MTAFILIAIVCFYGKWKFNLLASKVNINEGVNSKFNLLKRCKYLFLFTGIISSLATLFILVAKIHTS